MKKIGVFSLMLMIGFTLSASDNGPLCQLLKLSDLMAERVFFFNPLLAQSHSLFEFSIQNRSKSSKLVIFPGRLQLPPGAGGLLDCLRASRPGFRSAGFLFAAYELTSMLLDRGLTEKGIDPDAARYLRAALPLVVAPDCSVTWFSGKDERYHLYPKHTYVRMLVVPKKEEAGFLRMWNGSDLELCDDAEKLS